MYFRRCRASAFACKSRISLSYSIPKSHSSLIRVRSSIGRTETSPATVRGREDVENGGRRGITNSKEEFVCLGANEWADEREAPRPSCLCLRTSSLLSRPEPRETPFFRPATCASYPSVPFNTFAMIEMIECRREVWEDFTENTGRVI